jgi:hypothetical protein
MQASADHLTGEREDQAGAARGTGGAPRLTGG